VWIEYPGKLKLAFSWWKIRFHFKFPKLWQYV
jgi:hypothetical protein